MNCEYQKHFVFVIANYPMNRISFFRTFWIDQSTTNLFIFITQLSVNYNMDQYHVVQVDKHVSKS